MAFKKGDKKPANSGRTKGTKNKYTAIRDDFIELLLEENKDDITLAFKELNAAQKIQAFTNLCEFVKPKLSRAEHTLDDETKEALGVIYYPKKND